MDLPDIEIVVQYKATCTLCALWQRFGRAARGIGNKGTAILLVEKKHFRRPGGADAGGSIKNSSQKKRKECTNDIDQPPPAKRLALSDNVINVQPTPSKLENVETSCVEGKQLDQDVMAEPSMCIDDLIADCCRRYAQLGGIGNKRRKVERVSGSRKAAEEGGPMDDYINAHLLFDCRRVVLRTYFESEKACT